MINVKSRGDTPYLMDLTSLYNDDTLEMSLRGGTGKRRNTVITRRGIIVRNIVIALLVLLAIAVVDSLTTPDACKVDVSQMSQGCKDLLYPN
jgi:hypothetical protein